MAITARGDRAPDCRNRPIDLLQTEGHGYGPNPKNDGHHYGELGHEYAELLANNTRTVNGALRLYHIAMNGTCNNYISALIQGRYDGNTAILNLLYQILVPGMKGRIHPQGLFPNPLAVSTYFMLACTQGSSKVVDEIFKEVVVWNNAVMYDMDFILQSPTGFNRTLSHVGEARVNADGRVCGFKVNFQRFGLALGDTVLPAIAGFDALKVTQNASITSTCNTIQQICADYPQYASVNDCYGYLSTIPNGGWERADQKDRGCVRLHQIFAGYRPDIHCVHVGPTGGGFCVPHPQPNFSPSDATLWEVCDSA